MQLLAPEITAHLCPSQWRLMASRNRLSTTAFAGAVTHPGRCFGFYERAAVAVVWQQIGSHMEPLLPSWWDGVSGERERMVITAYCRNMFWQNAHF